MDQTSSFIGFGLVLRDYLGKLSWCKAMKTPGRVHAKVAEALCLKEALSWEKEEGLASVQIESDALMVVNGSLKADVDNSEFGGLLATCRNILLQLQHVSIGHICQEANCVAHYLAKSSFRFNDPIVWHETPDFLQAHIVFDVEYC